MNERKAGKITISVVLVSAIIFVSAMAIRFSPFVPVHLSSVNADTATTSVTVVNTPPNWSVDAQEYVVSSTSTPTNASSTVTWVGTAIDDNSENYYLLLCKTTSTPTANASAAPTCAGGASNQWGVSPSTISSIQATTTYIAKVTDVEANDWYAWICDGNPANPRCNTTYKTGTGNTASPFVVNHRPAFTSFVDDSPKNPGDTVTWTSVSSDADVYGGQDLVTLYVCKASDFNGTACGAGGTYCTSSATSSNPTCNFALENPKQDTNYSAYGYVIDNHNFAALGGSHGSDSSITISNVAPSIASSSIQLLDTDEAGGLTLTSPSAQTSGFKVKLTVTDNNSCQNASAGQEIASALVNVYRSGIGQAGCQTSGNYNANNCYAGAVSTSTWNVSCTQDGGSCSGGSDSTATWTCTFPLWFLADPTDGSSLTDSTWFAENWLPSVRVTDDNTATSTLTEASSGNEVLSFMAYTLNTSQISYGSLEPGQRNDPVSQTTLFSATGNVGLDQTLYGNDMCTTYPSCNPVSTTSTIPKGKQHYATSGLAYASAIALIVDPGAELELNVLKTTSTSTPANANTFWGIEIPSSITLAGDYTGQNTFIGIKGEAQSW
ncbi:MAG: hypothetical protein AAB495_03390 [Patescibacteria group bacterium]